jgi:hypothetical protein
MKRFFTRACAKIGRLFWSWGFLKFVLAVIALVILLYIEEDWRGAHNWAVTKAKWEAKGETFDYSKFIPPPVPDDQNLAALPLFKLGPAKYPNGTSYLAMTALNQASHSDLENFEYVPTGGWQKGELPDMSKIQKAVAANYAIVFKDAKPPDDTLAQFNAIYPFCADLLAATATHPVFRINEDYAISPPAARSLGPITAPIHLSQILTLQAIIALDQHQPDLALQDIKTNYLVLSGVKRDPTLVAGLVAIGMNAIDGAAIYEGLAQHEWSDAQLVELDQTLKPINFLADFQFAMRCEVAQSAANLEFFERANLTQMQETFGRGAVAESGLQDIFRFRWPSGWWDGNKTRMATRVFLSLGNVDPQAHLVFPNGADDLQLQIEKAKAGWIAYAPWNILADIAAGPITRALQKYAQAQVWVDETRIACALERYRLAQGVYPASLDALAPAYIDALPHDIMNGQPYHYQLRPDGTYLLYSVGWNQTDDGGKIAFQTDNPRIVDYTQGDWAWPTPQYARAQSIK